MFLYTSFSFVFNVLLNILQSSRAPALGPTLDSEYFFQPCFNHIFLQVSAGAIPSPVLTNLRRGVAAATRRAGEIQRTLGGTASQRRRPGVASSAQVAATPRTLPLPRAVAAGWAQPGLAPHYSLPPPGPPREPTAQSAFKRRSPTAARSQEPSSNQSRR